MAPSTNDKPRRRGHPAVMGAVYLVVLVAAGVTTGLLGREANPALFVVVLGLVAIGGGVGLGLYVNRSLARAAGVPRAQVRPLARRIQREDIPVDPAERAAMGRILDRQRENVARLDRYRWAYLLLVALFVLAAVAQYLDGRAVLAVVLLIAGALQSVQPFVTRRTLRRLDRVDAELTRRQRPAP